jgi:hypothetical protein
MHCFRCGFCHGLISCCHCEPSLGYASVIFQSIANLNDSFSFQQETLNDLCAILNDCHEIWSGLHLWIRIYDVSYDGAIGFVSEIGYVMMKTFHVVQFCESPQPSEFGVHSALARPTFQLLSSCLSM